MTGAELVGENIRRLRKARGLKQTALAELSGYSAKGSGTISKIERGHLVIDINMAERMARALDVAPSALFAGPETEASREIPRPLPPEIRRMLAIWSTLSPSEREVLQRTAELFSAAAPDTRRRLAEQIESVEAWQERDERHWGPEDERDALTG
jgi:transcriptional regulator with XRE-family HTH domain